MSTAIKLSELWRFRTDAKSLEAFKDANFKSGTIVFLRRNDGRVDNYGLSAHPSDGCPPDMLLVRFENGNVWWKPLELVEPADIKTIPPWARRMKLHWAGYKTLRP